MDDGLHELRRPLERSFIRDFKKHPLTSSAEHRRIFRREFEMTATDENRAHELSAARRLLQRLLKSNDHFKDLRL